MLSSYILDLLNGGWRTTPSYHPILFEQQHFVCQDLVWHSHPVEVNTRGHRSSLTVFAIPDHTVGPGKHFLIQNCFHDLPTDVEDIHSHLTGFCQIIFDRRNRIEGIGIALEQLSCCWGWDLTSFG